MSETEVVVVLPSNVLDGSRMAQGQQQPYEAPFNQAILGNAYGEFGLGEHERYIAEKLYQLSERLGNLNPENQTHGGLGGEWGYGQDFKNDTFETRPYYWGDCDCGWEEKLSEFSQTIEHKTYCFQNKWEQWNKAWKAQHSSLRDKRHWRKAMDAEQKANEQFCRENGKLDGTVGCAVHCDCGHDEILNTWCEANKLGPEGHKLTCATVLPNFRYQDIDIRWYKYIGRGMTINRKVNRKELVAMFRACFASIATKK